MGIVWLAAVGASVVVVLVCGLLYVLARKERPAPAALGRLALVLWLLTLLANVLLLYVVLPAMTGPYGGWQWLFWPLLGAGVLLLLGAGGFQRIAAGVRTLNEEGEAAPARSGWWLVPPALRARVAASVPRPRLPAHPMLLTGAALLLGVVLLASLGNWAISVATTAFQPNAQALAALSTITRQPATAQLPATDPSHLVVVTQGIAADSGQQAILAAGQGLGASYHTDRQAYSLQSVAGHLYWIAPLIYNEIWSNLGRWESPGYVVVDAEDPHNAPVVRTGYHLRYLPQAVLNQNVVRHAYLSGYTSDNLIEPTFVVDDAWRPYVSLTLMQPARGFTADVVHGLLLVDPQSGAITRYAPSAVPAWVDRVLPMWAAQNNLRWWGQYANAPWFNPSRAGQLVPQGQMQLFYAAGQQPVWLQPMASATGNTQTSAGVVLYSTRDTAGQFFPITGLADSNSVADTFTAGLSNIRDFGVGSLQLYQIYGEPTWVATYVRDTIYGQSFQAFGIANARRVTPENVIIAPTKTEALAAYAQWLAIHNIQPQRTLPSGKETSVEGVVSRISVATERGSSVYYLRLAGDSRIFRVGLELSAQLPLTRPGDRVRLRYLDTGQQLATLIGFENISLAAP